MMATDEKRKYISVEEAAVRFGKSVATIRRMLARKEIVYRGERGRQKLLDADEVKAAIEHVRPIEEKGNE